MLMELLAGSLVELPGVCSTLGLWLFHMRNCMGFELHVAQYALIVQALCISAWSLQPRAATFAPPLHAELLPPK